jgi:hypothetical protein
MRRTVAQQAPFRGPLHMNSTEYELFSRPARAAQQLRKIGMRGKARLPTDKEP